MYDCFNLSRIDSLQSFFCIQRINTQIGNYQSKLKLAEETDSLRLSQISQYKGINEAYYLQIGELNKSLSKKDKTILGLKIGCVTVSAGIILLLLLK